MSNQAPPLNKLCWPAPAKINLFLHITKQRRDGYHELQTVFQFLDICDCLYIQARRNGKIRRCYQHEAIAEKDDLIIRAAQLLKTHVDLDWGADIQLCKRLPIGGGVGGGSSDAATVLLALNYLWQTKLSTQALADLGRQLGADVPVFIYGHACWAEGIGQIITPITLPEKIYLLLYPNHPVATSIIFSSTQLTRDTPLITIRDFLDGKGNNDCEAVVRKQVPVVDEAMRWLDQYAPSQLTGTGSCIFAPFDTWQLAYQVAKQCPGHWTCHVGRANNVSPLHQMLNNMR